MRICSRLSSDAPRLNCVPVSWRTSQDCVRRSIIEDDEASRLSLAGRMRSVGHRGESDKDRIQVSGLSQSAKISTALAGLVAIVRSEEEQDDSYGDVRV
jgi:hypothetical protein